MVLGLAAVLATGLLVSAWAWYGWWPNHRPHLDAGERLGVDVSHHQGTIDWPAVAGDGIGFAYIKASEGATFVDERFAENWAGAGAAGLDWGAYHFFTLCRTGRDQAENFLRVVPLDEAMLPPALDLELAGNCSARPDRAWVDEQVDAFIERVEAGIGLPVVLYLGPAFDARYGVTERLDRPVWHRRLLLRPERDDWWIWQFHFRASVDGIDGGVDLNVMRPEPPRRSRPT
jgi:lysozyme